MPAEPVLIVALSGRALAQSARAAGWLPFVLDAFGDLDMREAAAGMECLPVDGDWRFVREALLEAADRLAPPPIPLIYGSGFERHPDLLEALARGRELLGTAPAAIRHAKDPFAFAGLLEAAGLPHPDVRAQPPDDLSGWLVKRRAGAGGGHIRPASAGRARPESYYQRRVEGRAVSVLVLGDGSEAVSLAASEQWTDPTPDRPYRYGGAAAPVEVPGDLFHAAARVAAASGLRGLGSLDALVDGELHWILELNLRPGASLDAYDRAYGLSLFQRHVAACRGGLETLPPPPRAAASAVVWASERVEIPAGMRWPVWAADRGAPGSVVPAGGPVCTVLGEGLSPAEARQVAETRAFALLSRLGRQARRTG